MSISEKNISREMVQQLPPVVVDIRGWDITYAYRAVAHMRPLRPNEENMRNWQKVVQTLVEGEAVRLEPTDEGENYRMFFPDQNTAQIEGRFLGSLLRSLCDREDPDTEDASMGPILEALRTQLQITDLSGNLEDYLETVIAGKRTMVIRPKRYSNK